MFLTLPSGTPYFAPQAPATRVEQAAAVPGGPILARDLEWDIAGNVAFHRRSVQFNGIGGAQSIPNSAWTSIDLSAIVDTADAQDPDHSSRVGWFNANTTVGWHLVTGMVPLGSATSGRVGIAGLLVNGTTRYEGGRLTLGSGHATTMMACDLLNLSSGNYVELQVWHNSGAAVSTQASATKVLQLTVRWACRAASANAYTVADPGVPRTWTATDILTADSTGAGEVPWNVHVRDVLRWLQYPPAARIDSQGTSQTIPSGAWTSINFTAEQLDNYNGHSTSTNPSRYVCQRPGVYFVHGLAALNDPSGATGYRTSRLLVNGTTAYAGTSTVAASGTTAGSGTAATAHIRLAVGDYVELQSFQSQGSALAVKSGQSDASRLICLWRSL